MSSAFDLVRLDEWTVFAETRAHTQSKRTHQLAQFKRDKCNISGWIILDKLAERCQRKCAAVSRFGSAIQTESNG